MPAGVPWLRRQLVLLGILLLPTTGCTQERDNSTADTTTTTTSPSTTVVGPAPFVAEARAMTFGSKDLAAASEQDLLRLGKVVCDGLAIKGLGVGRVVQRLVQSEARPTTTEASALVSSAVRNLCPQHAGAIG